MCIRPDRRRMGGISLVELIIFIVVVSVGVAGLLIVFNASVAGSAKPMRHKQAIAIAESLLTEIEQQAFTFCDPDDVRVLFASGTADCTGGAANSQDKTGGVAGSILTGPVPAGGTRLTFNNVSDYGGFAQTNIQDASGANAMAGYSAVVTIRRAAGTAPFATIPDDNTGRVLQIVVTVTHDNESVSLTGYRFRYAPNIPG